MNYDDQITEILRDFADYVERELRLPYVDINFYTSGERDIRSLLVFENTEYNAEGNHRVLDVNVKLRIKGTAKRWDEVMRYTQNLINNLHKERRHDVIFQGTERLGDLQGNSDDEFETETSIRLCGLVGLN